MTLAAMIRADRARLFDVAELAETVTYTPTSGDAATGIPAIVKRLGEVAKDVAVQYEAEIKLHTSDVTARPLHGATIIATDDAGEMETWELVANATGRGGVWLCKCTRARRPHFQR